MLTKKQLIEMLNDLTIEDDTPVQLNCNPNQFDGLNNITRVALVNVWELNTQRVPEKTPVIVLTASQQ
jgi:hypothetical protein